MVNTLDLKMWNGKDKEFHIALDLQQLPVNILIGKNGNSPPATYLETLDYAGLGIQLQGQNILVSAPFDLSNLVRNGQEVEADLILKVCSSGVYAASTLSHEGSWITGKKHLISYGCHADLVEVGREFDLTRYYEREPVMLSAHLISGGNNEFKIKSPLEYTCDMFSQATMVDFPKTWKSSKSLGAGSVRIITGNSVYIVQSMRLEKAECKHLITLCEYISSKPETDQGKRDSLHRVKTSILTYSGLIGR